MRPSSEIEVGISGTFDVANYGDLLFPIIAAEALHRREPRIRITPISPNKKSSRSWPFEVQSAGELHDIVPRIAAMLIGGGQIIRFDRHYPVPVFPTLDIPIVYWLLPAVLTAIVGKPVIWNGVGVWTETPPAPCYESLVREVLMASRFIGIRDVASQMYLARLAPRADIQPLPDTAFSLSRLWPLGRPTEEFVSWRESLGVEGPYAVIQANPAIGRYRASMEAILQARGGMSAVALPICWCHGDRGEAFSAIGGRIHCCPTWLSPGLISEIIGRSELVIASSLHACIAGLSYGVPVARAPVSPVPADRKFEILLGFDGIAMIENVPGVIRLLHRGRKIDKLVVECADRLEDYWDGVARAATSPDASRQKHTMTRMLHWLSATCGDIDRRAPASRPLAG